MSVNSILIPDSNTSETEHIIPVKDLENLEIERSELNKLIFKARVISSVTAFGVGGILYYVMKDIIFSIVASFIFYNIINGLLTIRRKKEFLTGFKNKIIQLIVKSFGLNYDRTGSVMFNDFSMLYDCSVDEYRGEDLIYGNIEGVAVKFSDFYAAKRIKTTKNRTETVIQFKGIIFVADFPKKLTAITQVCHRRSKNLARYGTKANMDDVRFEALFDVYSTDQINARYALTPLLMEKITELHLKLKSPLNIVFIENKIYIAIETWSNNFEPVLKRSFINNETVNLYMQEIEGFKNIVTELNLNRRIWC